MRRFLLFLFLLLSASFYPETGTVEELKSKLLARQPDYQSSQYQFDLARLQYRSERFSWFPQPYLSLSPSCSVLDAKTGAYSDSLAAVVGFTQKIPGGGILTGTASQSFFMNHVSSWSSSYSPSASVSLQMPFGFAVPSLYMQYVGREVADQDIALRIAALQLSASGSGSFASAISAIGDYLITGRKIEIAQAKDGLLKKKAEEDLLLWKQGRITSLELSNRDAARLSAYADLVQQRKGFLVADQNLVLNGLDSSSLTYDIDTFLGDLETYLKENQEDRQTQKEIEKLQLEQNWKNTLVGDLSALPTIGCSVTLNPVSSSSGDPSLLNAVHDYWAASVTWNWTASLSVSISLAPWDSSFQIGEKYLLDSSIDAIKREQNRIKTSQEKELRRKTLAVQEEACLQYAKNRDNAKTRYELYCDLAVSGRLSEMDLQLQQLTVESAECDWFRSRLDYILTALGFY